MRLRAVPSRRPSIAHEATSEAASEASEASALGSSFRSDRTEASGNGCARKGRTMRSSSLGKAKASEGGRRRTRLRATERSWGREVRPYLAKRAPKQVLVEEASEMASVQGTYLLDVRLSEDYEQVHAKGSVNVPLFRPIQGTGERRRHEAFLSLRRNESDRDELASTDASSLLKRAVYAVNGVKGSEENPNFMEQVSEAIPKDGVVLVMCDAGGAYLPTPSFMEGKKSR